MCHLWSGDMAGLYRDKTGFLLAFSSLSPDIIFYHLRCHHNCQGRAGEIQDSILQNGYLDMLKLEGENNTQDFR